MKIFLLIPDLGIGGAQKQFVSISKELRKNSNYKIYNFSINSDNRYLVFNQESFEVTHLRKNGGIVNLFFALLNYIYMLCKHKPDIVYAWLGRGHKFAIIGRFFVKSKIIFAFRNTDYESKKYRYINFYYIFNSLIDYNICNSILQIQYLSSTFNFKINKLYYLPNGFKFDNYIYTSQTWSHQIKVLLPSRIAAQKNQFEVLNVINENRIIVNNSFKFNIVGPIFDQIYFKKLSSFCKDFNLESMVYFDINCKNISNYYISTDIVLLSSIHEGFSNVILETWAHKKIILISELADPNNIIIDGINGFKYNSKLNLIKKLIEIKGMSVNEIYTIHDNGVKELNKYSFHNLAANTSFIFGKVLKH
jgi:glycosyltransferase involved in cell wall biosynthesis